jgi:lipopolysaccharide transport system ATP-binding protein
MLLDRGECLLSGAPKLVVANYHKLISAPHEEQDRLREEIRSGGETGGEWPEIESSVSEKLGSVRQKGEKPFYDPGLVPKTTVRYVSRGAEILDPKITTLDGERVNNLVGGQDYIYCYKVRFLDDVFEVRFGMLIKTITGFELGGAVTTASLEGSIPTVAAGRVVDVKFRFSCLLTPGAYFLNCGVLGTVEGIHLFLDRSIDAMMFRVMSVPNLRMTGIVDFRIRHSIDLPREQ